MDKLKPETIAKIRELLRADVDNRKDRMIRMIEDGYDNGLDVRIEEYRTAYNAFCDFEDAQEGK